MDHTTALAQSPTVSSAFGILENLKAELHSLSSVFDSLDHDTAHIAETGNSESLRDLAILRKYMSNLQAKTNDGIEEVELLFKNLREQQLESFIRQQAEKIFADQVKALVETHVAECLKIHVSQDLQDQVAENKRLLQEARCELHNSESRRANELLRADDKTGKLRTMIMSNGKASVTSCSAKSPAQSSACSPDSKNSDAGIRGSGFI